LAGSPADDPAGRGGSVVLALVFLGLILAGLDDTAPDGVGAQEHLVERLAVTLTKRLAQRRQILGEARQHLQDRIAVGKKRVAPELGIGRAIRVKSRKPPAENLMTSD